MVHLVPTVLLTATLASLSTALVFPPSARRQNFRDHAFSRFHRRRRRAPSPLSAIDVTSLPEAAFAATSLPHLSEFLAPSDEIPGIDAVIVPIVMWISIVFWCDRAKGLLLVDPSWLSVAPSGVPGAGAGLFANADMKSGTVLGTYPGVQRDMESFVTTKLQDTPRCKEYVWRFEDDKYILDPTNRSGDVDEILYGGAPYVPLSDTILGPGLLGRFFRVDTSLARINEPPPGGGYDVSVRAQEDCGKRTVVMMLTRDVEKGEELFMDYGRTYDRSNYDKWVE
mmetsp:Transcript_26/g.55  ORF Transcript_26/g.55 Transcript_26/m.55 type:complete len:282 (-) Transcript_26:417-1262(-)